MHRLSTCMIMLLAAPAASAESSTVPTAPACLDARQVAEPPQSCPDLDSAPAISFRSGVGISPICGNPGDRVVADGTGDSV